MIKKRILVFVTSILLSLWAVPPKWSPKVLASPPKFLETQKDNPVENHSLELSFIKSIPMGFYCVFFENPTLF